MFHSNYKNRRSRNSRKQRRGNILVLSAVMMVMVMGFVAFAIDIGSLSVARGELQRCADAAAMAAAWDLVDNAPITATPDYTTLKNHSRSKASQYAAWNKVLSSAPSLPTSDVEVGIISDPTVANSAINTNSTGMPNAVRVTVRRTSGTNGAIAFTFGRVLGKFSQECEAQATAATISKIGGFRTPGDGDNLGILPIAADDPSFMNMLAGVGPDLFRWDPDTKTLVPGSDGIKEMNLYPQGNLTPGNRGTVDIGSPNNSTAHLASQILHGITPADLAYHGGELKFDSTGKLYLNGDTGISAGIKDELATLIGKTRIIPIFSNVTGPGNNATYTIIKWAGVRILNVKLTGANSSKRVTIQPAAVTVKGAISTTATNTSYYTYSPVWLVK